MQLKHELDEVKAQNIVLNKEIHNMRNTLANASRAIQASLQVWCYVSLMYGCEQCAIRRMETQAMEACKGKTS